MNWRRVLATAALAAVVGLGAGCAVDEDPYASCFKPGAYPELRANLSVEREADCRTSVEADAPAGYEAY